MSKSPAVLFYTSDFLTGTILFTDEETGQYIRLLCHQHQLGHLPKKHILKICGSTESPVLDKFQADDKGLYFNKRMEEEINKRQEHAEKQRVRIQNYWNEKKKMEEPEPFHGNTVVLPLDNDNDNDNDNYNGNGNGKKKVKNNLVQHDKTFEIFWESYPNRAAKKQCLAIWRKIDFIENPFPMILEKLESLKASWGWTKDGGQFIPMARTWLNREGWHDTIKTEPPKKESEWIC